MYTLLNLSQDNTNSCFPEYVKVVGFEITLKES